MPSSPAHLAVRPTQAHFILRLPVPCPSFPFPALSPLYPAIRPSALAITHPLRPTILLPYSVSSPSMLRTLRCAHSPAFALLFPAGTREVINLCSSMRIVRLKTHAVHTHATTTKQKRALRAAMISNRQRQCDLSCSFRSAGANSPEEVFSQKRSCKTSKSGRRKCPFSC